jgi:quercetin dioxygenase-like cupin family protein
MKELEAELADQGRSYLPFLNRSTLRCGVYFLKAGATDNQAPHREDEVYYVRSGKAKLQVEGEDYDADEGAVLFVAANAKHHFHTIEEDLTLLVFFSTADPGEKASRDSSSHE